jgi:hypothetical protein
MVRARLDLYIAEPLAEPESDPDIDPPTRAGSRIENSMAARALARALQARLGFASLALRRAESARTHPLARLEPARVHH